MIKKLIDSGFFQNVEEVFTKTLLIYHSHLKYQEYLKLEIQKGLDDYFKNGTVETKVEEIAKRSKDRLNNV